MKQKSNRTERRQDRQRIHVLLMQDYESDLPEPSKAMARHRQRKIVLMLRKRVFEKAE
jgi:hypothetical protein